MADNTLLTDDRLDSALATLDGWNRHGDRLRAELTFADFAEALGFMVRVGVVAERMNHHPEWTNVYNRVTVELTTHDAGGITGQDLALAELINAAYHGT